MGPGKQLRQELAESIEVVLKLSPRGDLLEDQPWIKESIKLRNPYTDPLNVLQAELLPPGDSAPRAGQGADDHHRRYCRRYA